MAVTVGDICKIVLAVILPPLGTAICSYAHMLLRHLRVVGSTTRTSLPIIALRCLTTVYIAQHALSLWSGTLTM